MGNDMGMLGHGHDDSRNTNKPEMCQKQQTTIPQDHDRSATRYNDPTT